MSAVWCVGSQNFQKRKILNLIFADLLMKEKSIEIIMKKPFQYCLEGYRPSIWGTIFNEYYNFLIH